jgi:UDP:flavonoid glycosyltransferase YjiC (YdhE family)
VGGLQISETKKLPSELRKFIESAPKGAIIFCMGTNFRTELLSHEEKETFFKMIREMSDYHFLWKFDENYANGFEIPPNLLIHSWMPQQEILAHPKVVGFVSHCGLLSTHEAHWFAVPIIGIPVYVDQHINCARVKKSKVGEVLPLMEMTANHTIETVRRVVEMPIYRENMKKKSKIFRHQKELPIERAVWWTEFLLENSADHLKSPALEMGFFKSNSYDVMIILFTAIFTVFKLSKALLQFIIFKWTSKPQKNIKRE